MGQLAGALGRLDSVVVTAEHADVDGWMVHPDHPVDRVRVVLNGRDLGATEVFERPDVGRFVAPVAHAARCGYRLRAPVDGLLGAALHVESIGLCGGEPMIRTEDYRRAADGPAVPSPDGTLMLRVSGSDDAGTFGQTGYCIAAQLLAAVRAHAATPAPRVLDWGCGSGRATRYLPLLWPGLALTGCDIDAQAVAWCRDNIAGARFDATGPFPPLPYADGAFDAVIASSVMTHLADPVQQQWLREIRRVLAPGGVFVASALGTLAALALPDAERATLAAEGIMDGRLDPALDGVAPENYYRSTYQSEAFIRRHWGAVLDVVAFQAAGLTNYQDLVVMRKDASLWRRLVRR